jgi:hypothetical protein
MVIAGCTIVPESYRSVAEFRRKCPLEFRKYSYLNPISLDTYKSVWGDGAWTSSMILGETERRFGSNQDVKEFVKSMSEHAAQNREAFLKHCHDLEIAATNAGTICQYQWSDGTKTEAGFLVLQSGEVVMRKPWFTEFIPK